MAIELAEHDSRLIGINWGVDLRYDDEDYAHWVCGDLLRSGPDRLARGDPTQRNAPAGAHGHSRGAHAGARPLAKRVLDDAIFARVIRDHGQRAAA